MEEAAAGLSGNTAIRMCESMQAGRRKKPNTVNRMTEEMTEETTEEMTEETTEEMTEEITEEMIKDRNRSVPVFVYFSVTECFLPR